jgi:CRP/FNR family transcriptional regulator, cyclic AMP receptor protein
VAISAKTVSLLAADSDLGENLGPDALQEAGMIRARVLNVPRGVWHPTPMQADATGVMVISGLMVRRLRLGPVSSSEIVGPSDVLRPWESDLIPALVPAFADWRVLGHAQLAILDGPVTEAIGRLPELSAALSARMIRRSRSLAYLMAAQHFLRVEDRVLATLWHLAAMWGRVTLRGTVVPFRLTHEMLAQMVGARRPTTTTAIQALSRSGRMFVNEERQFVLIGDPPDWGGSTPAAPIET